MINTKKEDETVSLTLFQVQLKKLFEKKEQKVISDVIRLCLFKNSEKSQQNLLLVELYDYLGLDRFVEFISLFEEKTIKVPSLSSFQEAVQTCICLYLKNYKNKSWENIEETLFLEGTKPKKLGRKVQTLQNFINYSEEKTIDSLNKKVKELKDEIRSNKNSDQK